MEKLKLFSATSKWTPCTNSYNNVKISTNIFGIFWKINSRQGDEKDKLERLAKTNIQATGLNF